MGKRLTRIYTKTGDHGKTGLGDGSRVEKDHIRVEAFGTVDELNAAIGLLLSDEIPEDIAEILTQVQHDLFDLGGELCIPGHALLKDERVEALERSLDFLNAELPALEEFILPGGTRSSAICHLTRTICRRAERRIVTLARKEQIGAVPIRYLNRLSDLLFVIARFLNKSSGQADVLWDRKR